MPVRTRGRRLPLPAAVLLVLASAGPAGAQTTYTWTGAAGEIGPGQWLNPVNWSGGPAGTRPGVTTAGLSSDGTATDIARINTFPGGTGNGLGIDFGAAGGQLTLGAIHFDGSTAAGLTTGNMSTTTPGVLRLNGATINSAIGPVANVVIGDTGQSDNVYTISPLPNGGTGGPGLTLQLGTPDAVFLTTNAILRINVPISQAAPGYGVTIRGGAPVEFFQTNTYSGPTRVIGGSLTINQDAALGTVPSSPTPNHLVIAPDPAVAGSIGELYTNAATFTIAASRGIAIGPATGTGDGTINVPDPDLPPYIPTITYNGVIANNGSGSGRLVLTGGGTLVLGGSSTYTGGTLNSAGVLLLTNVNALGTAGTVTLAPQRFSFNLGTPLPGHLLVQATGTFARPITVSYTGTATHPVIIGTPNFVAGGLNETLFSGAITLVGRPVTIQGGNDYRTRFTGPITGTGSVTVTGTAAGRVVLFDGGTGNDFTYSGGTTVASGTLLAVGQSPTQSATGSGSVAVTGGTLGGNGRVAGAVTVGSTGRITAGTSLATRILNLGSTLQIDGGRYRVTLFGSGNDEASRLAVVGAATLTNSPSLELDLNGQTVQSLREGGPRTYMILNAASVTPNGFAPPNFTSLGFDASEWSLSYPNGNTVLLSFNPVPVPEPTAGLALAAGLAGAGWLARRGRLISPSPPLRVSPSV
jgi:autotransporter-associated beta strand protein